MSKAEVTLPAAVSSVPTARHFVESILNAWGLDELGWNATLIVSELAANAALHAHGEDFTVRVQSEADGVVRLEVRDCSGRLPQQRSYSDDATTGRGLRLVRQLSTEWGVTPGAGGKTVWALLRPTPRAGGEREATVEDLLAAYDDSNVIPIQEGTERFGAQTAGQLGLAA